MTSDQLFLNTLEDLDKHLALARGEHDARKIAWLLRKLLINRERSLVAIVGTNRPLPTFEVDDVPPAPDLEGWFPLVPQPWRSTVLLTQAEFLRRPVIELFPDGSASRKVSVSELIRYFATDEGAERASRPSTPWRQALWTYCWSATPLTPDGEYNGGTLALTEVAQVTRVGLEPVRSAVAADLRPEAVPEWARRASRRVRDALNFGR